MMLLKKILIQKQTERKNAVATQQSVGENKRARWNGTKQCV